MELLLGIVLVFGSLALMVGSIVLYILRSIALCRIAKRRGVKAAWLAWIPLLHGYVLGGVAEKYDAQKGLNYRWGKVMVWLSVLYALCYVAFMALSFNVAYLSMYGVGDVESMVGGSIVLIYVVAAVLALVAGSWLVIHWISAFKLFESCKGDKTMKYLLLSLFVPATFSICLWLCRNYDMGVDSVNVPWLTENAGEAAQETAYDQF